jgi:hypothetical protein
MASRRPGFALWRIKVQLGSFSNEHVVSYSVEAKSTRKTGKDFSPALAGPVRAGFAMIAEELR